MTSLLSLPNIHPQREESLPNQGLKEHLNHLSVIPPCPGLNSLSGNQTLLFLRKEGKYHTLQRKAIKKKNEWKEQMASTAHVKRACDEERLFYCVVMMMTVLLRAPDGAQHQHGSGRYVAAVSLSAEHQHPPGGLGG